MAGTNYNVTVQNGIVTSYTGIYDVTAYGAVGDGLTDDSGAIGAAISACGAAGGGVVYCPASEYYVGQSVSVSVDGVTLRGCGMANTSIVTDSTSTSIWIFEVTGNDFTIEDIAINNGPAVDLVAASAPSGEGLVTFYGTSPTQASGLTVRRCRFDGINSEGFVIEYAKNVRFEDCEFEDINNSAIGIRDTCDDIEIIDCSFKDIVCTGSAGTNRYFVHNGADELYSADNTNAYFVKGYRVEGCTFKNNPVWEGLDTHGGERIRFINNVIIDCYVGMLVSCADSGGSEYVADPRLDDVIVEGNTIKIVDATSFLYGIVVNGSSGSSAGASAPYGVYNVNIKNNTISGYGGIQSIANTYIGAVNIDRAYDVTVEGNTIEEFWQYGILFRAYCGNCRVRGNMFHNAQGGITAIIDRVSCITIREGEVYDLLIEDNAFWDEDGAIDYAIHATSVTSTDAEIGDNFFKPYSGGAFARLSANMEPFSGRIDRCFQPAAEPSDPTEGMTYYDSTANKLKVYTGSAWETITSS